LAGFQYPNEDWDLHRKRSLIIERILFFPV
jgi:hypothetical protein